LQLKIARREKIQIMLTRREIIGGVLAAGMPNVGHALEQCPGSGTPPGTCAAMIDPQRFMSQHTVQFQRESQWCWAASISMICNWHGYPTSQERIVSELYGGLVNMSGDDMQLVVALDHRHPWKSDDGRKFLI
jgi:hypothetical protein